MRCKQPRPRNHFSRVFRVWFLPATRGHTHTHERERNEGTHARAGQSSVRAGAANEAASQTGFCGGQRRRIRAATTNRWRAGPGRALPDFWKLVRVRVRVRLFCRETQLPRRGLPAVIAGSTSARGGGGLAFSDDGIHCRHKHDPGALCSEQEYASETNNNLLFRPQTVFFSIFCVWRIAFPVHKGLAWAQ